MILTRRCGRFADEIGIFAFVFPFIHGLLIFVDF